MEVDYNWDTIHGSPKRGYNRNGNYPIGRSIPKSSKSVVWIMSSNREKLYNKVEPFHESSMSDTHGCRKE
jgi:hypothetical protein